MREPDDLPQRDRRVKDGAPAKTAQNVGVVSVALVKHTVATQPHTIFRALKSSLLSSLSATRI